MSASQRFDTVIIGAGVAGLGAAALLAKDFGQRVLVLERAPFIGGRTLSYVGQGNTVTADGVEMDAEAFRKSLAFAHCYLGKCTPSIEEMKRVLANDGVLILPMDGQVLENPYYTEPGPERHMLVVVGYDDATEEFITNDPGTRRGAEFRYSYENIFIAMRDYPTGDVLAIETLKKSAIAVYREVLAESSRATETIVSPENALE